MKIHFNGAAQTVTGSQYLLEINGSQILLECGLFQGKRGEYYQRNLTFHLEPRKIDAVILSHAHMDHSGNLPNLVKNGFNAPIYATKPTAALGDIMLRDSGHIQEQDAEYINKKRAKHGEPPIEPLYTSQDASDTVQFFHPVDYDVPFSPAPGVTARLVEAGHILGSAAIVLDIEEHGRKFRLWYSGDIGRPDLPLLRDPVLPEAPDYLIMECTYGDKPHPHVVEAVNEFRSVLLRALRRGGKVVIPSFAVGRTQELVYLIHRMYRANLLPRVPVYVDSPLAVNASDIFQKYPDYFDADTREFMRSGKFPPLNFDQLIYTRSVEEFKAINEIKEPAIIISASGMAETGRILHHLKWTVENPRNMVIIVSWQAPNTLGRRIAERVKEITIFGDVYPLRAEVATIGGLSAHAGQDYLLEYAQAASGTAKQIFLVHGEQRAYSAFHEKLIEVGINNSLYPEPYCELEL